MNQVVFDWGEGERRKEQGNTLAVEGKEFWIRVRAARSVAKIKATFTTDDVWMALGSVPSGHRAPSGMGSVMRYLSQEKEIMWTGTYKKSLRPEQHRKPIKVWQRTLTLRDPGVTNGIT